MNIRELVLKEAALEKEIEFYIEELNFIVDLMEIDKYKDSVSLKEKFIENRRKVMELAKEKKELSAQIEVMNIVVSA